MTGPPNEKRKLVGSVRPQIALTDWVASALRPWGLTPARHHLLLLSELEALSRGEIDRLMVLMPPGAAKSSYTSVLFPAWWFVVYPRSSVITTSHTADLSVHFARQVRGLIAEHKDLLGYDLASDSRSGGRWRTDCGGSYFATGIRGPLTGRRADLIIVDDPIKSQAEADSKWHRDRLWDWYRADLVTRLKPGGRLTLIMTRWHEDDIAGRLLANSAEEWRLLRLPALAEENDPLGRAVGEALWPEWEDEAALLRKQKTVGGRTWAALFQQTPRPLEGSLFKVAQISIVEASDLPGYTQAVRAWDLAATVPDERSNPDWTVGIKLLAGLDGTWIVSDVIRMRGTPMAVDNAIVSTARADGKSVHVGIPQDPGQAGKAQVGHITRLLAGHVVSSSPETGSKLTRAGPISSQVEAGHVVVVRAGWNADFLEELAAFPFGDKDDQVDALCRAFSMLSSSLTGTRPMRFPLIGR